MVPVCILLTLIAMLLGICCLFLLALVRSCESEVRCLSDEAADLDDDLDDAESKLSVIRIILDEDNDKYLHNRFEDSESRLDAIREVVNPSDDDDEEETEFRGNVESPLVGN